MNSRIEPPLDSRGVRAVLKLGGATLFSDNGIVPLLRDFASQPNVQACFVIVGGGDTIESMRRLHTLYPALDDEAMHWRCVQLLDATWEIARELAPDCHAIESMGDLLRASEAGMPGMHLVRVGAYYHPEQLAHFPTHWLPRPGWQTTTDVLSWLLAKRIKADRLWLVKQCDCESVTSLHEARQRGIIDSELERLGSIDPDPLAIEFVRAGG
jgi:5-(aminomethyl)-3-furanmethanol phosphate kinase